MAQPIVKYTLTKRGTIPGWLSSDSRAFAGEHGITGNKSGKIPRYEEPQDTIFLGIASGDPDPDGTPDDYVGTFANNTANSVNLTVTVFDNSTSTESQLAAKIPVPTGSSFVISDAGKTVLEGDDEVRVYCDTENAIDVNLSILKGVS